MKNSLPVSGLSEFANEVNQKPEEGKLAFGIKLDWETGTRGKVTTKTSKIGPHQIARAFNFTVDEPRQLLGTNHAPNPQEYLLSGLGSCLMVTFLMGATTRGVQIEDFSIEVEGELNLKGFLGLKTNQSTGFPEIRYQMKVSGDASEKEFETLRQLAELHSPTAQTFLGCIPMKGRLETIES